MNDIRELLKLDELFKLSVEERIQLIGDLWDSITADGETLPPLTEAQSAELDRRIAAYEKDPSATLDGEAVDKHLWSRVK